MDRLLRIFIGSLVRVGKLRVTTARGSIFTVGDGTGRPIAIRLTSRRAEWGILLDPELKLGEAYMDGSLVVVKGSIEDLLAMALSNCRSSETVWWARPQWLARYFWRSLQQFNYRSRAKRNVAKHYDLDGHLYSLFLDGDRQYSCGYFEHPRGSLDDAQLAKKRHIAAKLLIDSERHVLEVGSGWGGLALYLSGICGARVTGVTLSQEQLALSCGRAEEQRLADRVKFRLADYRDVSGTFDRIVSVGMFEHVGVGFYDTYFRKCSQLLADDGVMLLHSVGRSDGPGITNPWLAKYIFPGGYIPALSEVLPAIQRSGLLVTDIEILRLHYAETLKAWRERFLERREEIEGLYDERFCRMWEFYLASSEMAFREEGMMVFQIQLAKRQDVVPITRDYIAHEEAHLRALEAGRHRILRLAGE